MDKEYEQKSLDALLGSSPQEADETPQVDEPEVDLPQTDVVEPEQPTEEPENVEGNSEEPESEKSEEETGEQQPGDDDETAKRIARLEKQLQDTRKWGNDSNKKLREYLTKQDEEGLLDDDGKAQLAELQVADTDLAQAEQQFFQDLQPVAAYLKTQGQDPDVLVKSFQVAANLDEAVKKEWQDTPASDRVAYVLETGRKNLSLYNKVVEQGSVSKAIEAMVSEEATKAVDQFKTTLEVQASTANQSQQVTNKVKDRREVPGTSAPVNETYKQKSLNKLLI